MRLLLLSLLLVGTASAQDAVTLSPGHPDLDLSALTLADETVDVRMIAPEAQSLGTVTTTASLDGDVLTVVSYAEVPMSGPPTRDSTRLAWPSLALISHDVTRGGQAGSAQLVDGQIVGSFGGDQALPFEFDRDEPIFGTAAVELVLRALPLDRTGYRAIVPTFSTNDRFKETTLTVVGPEVITLDDGTEVEAIAVDQAGGGGLTQGFRQRHYLDATTREFLYSKLSPPGMTVHLVPISPDVIAARDAEEAAAAAAAGQNRLTPGSPALIAVPAETIAYKVLVVQPVQQEFGDITTTQSIADGRLTIISNVQIPQAGQNQQDTTVVAYPSLAPISRVEVTPSEIERSVYADGRMTTTTTAGDEVTTTEADLNDAFGPGVTRVLIRSLPLAEGYTASFDQMDADGEVSTSRVTVTGQEAYTLPDGTETMVWVVVEVEEGTPDYTYYVDATSRALHKMSFSPQPGVVVDIVAQ